jgi:hypothetical protein
MSGIDFWAVADGANAMAAVAKPIKSIPFEENM